MNLRSIALLVVLSPSAVFAQESCIVCHGKHGQLEADRIHARVGVDCVACHGGVPDAWTIQEAHAGGVRVPAHGPAGVEHCGSCHADTRHMRGFGIPTDQLLEYWTSSHGERLREDPEARVATCVDCHGSHGILPARDPRARTHPRNQLQTCGDCHSDAGLMASFELSVDAVELYRDSVHGAALLERGLLSSPACADCHGAHGATPPRVDEVGRVCGRCHVPAAEAFRESPHWAAARAGALEDCVSCHGSHEVGVPSLAMLVGDQRGHCGECHQPGSRALAVGQELHDLLWRFDASMRETEAALQRATLRGIFVDQQMAWLEQARALRSQAAPLIHTLDPTAVADVLEVGESMIERAQSSLLEGQRALRDRRIFVAAFALVVLLMAAALFLHAREVARRATVSVSPRSQPSSRGR